MGRIDEITSVDKFTGFLAGELGFSDVRSTDGIWPVHIKVYASFMGRKGPKEYRITFGQHPKGPDRGTVYRIEYNANRLGSSVDYIPQGYRKRPKAVVKFIRWHIRFLRSL